MNNIKLIVACFLLTHSVFCFLRVTKRVR